MTDSRYPPISNSVVPVGEHKVLLVLKLQADVLPTGHESNITLGAIDSTTRRVSSPGRRVAYLEALSLGHAF